MTKKYSNRYWTLGAFHFLFEGWFQLIKNKIFPKHI